MYNTEMDRQYKFARPSWYGIVAQLNGLSFGESKRIYTYVCTHKCKMRRWMYNNLWVCVRCAQSLTDAVAVKCVQSITVQSTQWVCMKLCVCVCWIYSILGKLVHECTQMKRRVGTNTKLRPCAARTRSQTWILAVALIHFDKVCVEMTSHCVTIIFPLASLWLSDREG